MKWWLLLIAVIYAGLIPAQTLPALIPFSSGIKWGYSDTDGNVVITPQWDDANFFNNEGAVVQIQKAAGGYSNIYGLINRQGQYIIGPEGNWTGSWQGWGETPLNVHDANGKYGLMDTLGRVVIPLEYEPFGSYPGTHSFHDSFRIVQKDGMFGVINRNNKIVVPCKYGSAYFREDMNKIRAVLVTDADNASGRNKTGAVLFDNNKVLFPTKYEDIKYVDLEEGGPALRISFGEYNPGSGGSASSIKFVSYPTGKEIELVKPKVPIERREQPEPGGYTSFWKNNYALRGLKDAGGKVVIPCCSVRKVTLDTIIRESKFQKSEDSLIVSWSYLRTENLKPYGPAQKFVLHLNEQDDALNALCGFNRRYWDYYESANYSRPSVVIAGRTVYEFYKDSLFYSLSKAIGESDTVLYRVQGQAYPSGRETYHAIVDDRLNYIAGPISGKELVNYNRKNGFVIMESYVTGFKYHTGYAVLTAKGDTVIPYQEIPLVETFKWKDKVYAFGNVVNYVDGERVPDKTRLINSLGEVDTSLAGYNIIYPQPKPGDNSYYGYGEMRIVPDALPQGAVAVRDSLNRIGYLFPDGSPVFPHLNFKYRQLAISIHGWFIAQTVDNGYRFINANNEEIVPGVSVTTLTKTRYDGLYKASGVDNKTKTGRSFYITKNGKAFYSPKND